MTNANFKFRDNNGQIVVGSDNNLQFFKYEITPNGGVVNILPPEQAPRVTALPTPINLRPSFFRNLFGREAEINQIIAALKDSQSVELHGAVGVGKSVLLRYLAHHPITQDQKLFSDGVIYFHLHQQEAMEDVRQRLFDAFYQSEPYFKPAPVRVRHDLQSKRALIILDNASLSRKDIEKFWEIAPNCVYMFSSLERNLWEEKPIQVGGISQDSALALIERELERSLTDQEKSAAQAIFDAMNGHPLEILQQIAGVRGSKEWLADVASRVQKVTSPKARVKQLLKPLDQQKRSILAALAALGGIALTANQVSAIVDVRDPKEDFATLERMHLVRQEDSRYCLSTNLLSSIQQIENLTFYLERAVTCFTKWAQNNPQELLRESEAISYLLQWSVKQGRWNDVLLLGKPFESALAVSGQWKLQDEVLQWYQQAAKKLGNREALGYALHQLGTREVCLGNFKLGHNLLRQANKIRRALGEQEAARLTQHNLGVTSESKFQVSSLFKRVILPASITSALVLGGLSLLGYKFLKAQQEITNLYQGNQQLQQEVASLKDQKSTGSNRESELITIIEKITKERDFFQKERDASNKKAVAADERAKDAEKEIEALKKRYSLISLQAAMRFLRIDVETCRRWSLKALEDVVAKEWGQRARVEDSGAWVTVTTDGKIIGLMCGTVGNGSIISISSASNTPKGMANTVSVTADIVKVLDDLYR